MSMQETKEYKLPTGDIIEAFSGADFIIDEVFRQNCYGQDFEIGKGMTVIDIGANQGIFALYAASKGSQVFCYEPDKRNFYKLKNNIARNSLGNVIKAYNLAIHDSNTSIKIYTPETQHFVTSGLITSKVSLVEEISKKTEVKLTVQDAEARTLSKVLQDIASDKIDLIKIDCEGAEFDILKAASKDDLINVRNLVMETHDAYQESELCFIVQDLGFNIKNHKKIDGFYGTGYLFADKQGGSHCKGPVAKLLAKKTFYIGEDIHIDASNSFSLGGPEKRLYYKWWLNGAPILGEDGQAIRLCDVPLGANRIEVVVSEGNQADRATLNFMVLEANHFNREVDEDLLAINEEKDIHVEYSKLLRIKKELLPKHFPFQSLVVRIYSKTGSDTNDGWVDAYAKRYGLSNGLTEIRVANPNCQQDVLFDLNVREGKTLTVKWGIE